MDDLLREFLTETNESLDVADAELVKFEQEPNNAEILNNIFRLVHTIKGTCGFIGLTRLATLAHAAETLMDKFRSGAAVTSEAVGVVLLTVDRIKEVLAEIEKHEGREPDGADSDLIERLEALADGTSASRPVLVAAPKPAMVERPLMPGEVSLDELERAFRETKVEIDPPQKPTLKASPPKPARTADEDAQQSEAPAAGVSSQSLRVSLSVLERLMMMVSELVLTRNQLMEIARRHEDTEYKVPLQRLSNVTGELQEAVMRTRMQPIGNAWQKLPRIVRDLAQDLGKHIDIEMVGADTELDRQVLDLIKDPLTHMIRNSADHGLETTEQRRAVGKPERGVIRLSARHEGGHIIIEISDDGRGLDVARIKAKVIEGGLASEAELSKMTEAQIHRFIFRAGFSTAAKITNVSGRGVGMDVVRRNIEVIGGSIDVRSKAGEGSTFLIKIPLTLAIVPALIVEAAGERFAIPQIAVVELVRISANAEHRVERINETPVLRLRDKLLPIVSLDALLGLHVPLDRPAADDGFVAVMQVANHSFGVVVDAVFHTEEIVVKPMSMTLRDITMFSGSTILGDGRVIMIVDPNGVARAVANWVDAADVEDADDDSRPDTGAAPVSLLLFRAGSADAKAVPLSLVTRLEKLDVGKIEHANGRMVAQYRDTLIPLICLNDDVKIKSSGTQPMLIFSDEERAMGLIVDEIVDIVEDSLSIELGTESPGALGAAIIRDRATEILDVSHYLTMAFGNWFERLAPQRKSGERRLLLVDDSSFFRGLLEPVVRSLGYHVQVCGSGAEALAVLGRDRHFDVIVSDIDMPQMDGFEFAAAVKSDPVLEDIPIIALSGLNTAEMIDRGRSVGFSDYIAKFDRAGLIEALNEFTGELRGEAA